MSDLKQIIMEMANKLLESVDIVDSYHPAPKNEKNSIPKDIHDWATNPGKYSSVDYAGGIAHKNGKLHLSVFHHNNGHTYIREHGTDVELHKSNKPVHHKTKELIKSYADNNAEDVKNYKIV